MALFASLGGARVTSARVSLAPHGCSVADVRLADADDLAVGALVLTLDKRSLVMSVVRSDSFAGSRAARLVAGYGGWRRAVKGHPLYRGAAGVRLRSVLRDLAAEVGEVMGTIVDRDVGAFFSRGMGPAARVLGVLVGREGWYVDDAGVTQATTRPTLPITSSFEVTRYVPEVGLVEVATEDLLAWSPGVVFEHQLLPQPMQASTVTIVMEDSGKLRLEVMTA